MMRVTRIAIACVLVIGCGEVAPRTSGDAGASPDASSDPDALLASIDANGVDAGPTTSCFGVASTSMALTVEHAVAAVGCSTDVASALSRRSWTRSIV